MYAKKNSGKKVFVLLLAVVMLIGCAIGGTVAYLMTSTTPVVNTFVAGDIGQLTLDETPTNTQTNGKNTYVIVPGKDITKDPKVSYTPATANDVGEVYIFVEVSGGAWSYNTTSQKFVADELSWSVAEGWTHLPDSNVFYMTTSTAVTNKAFIANNTISVGSTIEKGDDMTAAKNAADGLTFIAYAIQAEGFTGTTAASDAWAAVNPPANSGD